MLGQDASNGNEFSVSGAVESAVGLIHAPANDLTVLHKDTADWRLITGQCKLSLLHVIGQLQIAKR